jgi:hypothetical protein
MNHCPRCGRPNARGRGDCALCRVRRARGTLFTEQWCAVCGTGDVRVLRLLRLVDGAVTACANDAAIAGRRALTLAELRAERYPEGDRRADDRRLTNRRRLDRRALRGKGALEDRRTGERRK